MRGDRPTDLQTKVEADGSRDVALSTASVRIIALPYLVAGSKSKIQWSLP